MSRNKIKEFLKNNVISQKELANEIKVSENALSAYLNKKNNSVFIELKCLEFIEKHERKTTN